MTADHGASIHSTGSHGTWARCLCGWESSVMTTSAGASIQFARHLAADEGNCHE